VAVSGLFLAVIVVVLAGQWQEVRPLLGRLSAPSVLAAMAAVLVGIAATFLSWRAGLTDLGVRLHLTGGMRVFFLGQLGKYLPGSIWPAVTQMRLGRDYQVPQRASGAAVVVFMLMVIGTGLLVGVPVIPLLGAGATDEYHWLVLVLPLAMVLAAPPVLNRLIALALRVARRPPLPAPLSFGGILRVAGWSIGAWLLYGLQVFVLARQLGADGGWLLLQCTGAFAVAFASGPLLLVVPAGAGVREAALLLLLGPTITAPRAAVIAVVSRLLFIVGDLAWGGAAVLAARRRTHRRPSSSPPTTARR